jgi:hypothetical protein
MTRARGLLIGAFGLTLTLFTLACAETSSCDDYVDYVCECHADDPAYDCEALQTTYEAADDALEDECSIILADLEDQDDLDGTGCLTDTGGSDSGGDSGAGTGGDTGTSAL